MLSPVRQTVLEVSLILDTSWCLRIIYCVEEASFTLELTTGTPFDLSYIPHVISNFLPYFNMYNMCDLQCLPIQNAFIRKKRLVENEPQSRMYIMGLRSKITIFFLINVRESRSKTRGFWK